MHLGAIALKFMSMSKIGEDSNQRDAYPKYQTILARSSCLRNFEDNVLCQKPKTLKSSRCKPRFISRCNRKTHCPLENNPPGFQTDKLS